MYRTLQQMNEKKEEGKGRKLKIYIAE